MRQGEIWQVSLPVGSGREQSGSRPALVLQNESFGAGSPLVLVAVATTQLAAVRFPATLVVDPTSANGLTARSAIMIFQARALDRKRFLRRLGELEADQTAEAITLLGRLTELVDSSSTE